MRIILVLCVLGLALFAQAVLAQDNPVEQEARFTKIEVTLKHLNETISSIDARLDNILFAIMGLFAAFFIPIFILILQIKTQLRDLVNDMSNLKDEVSGLEERMVQNQKEFMRHTTDLSITTHKQLNQIREALAV